ncbi:hypothetical protein FSP39_015495 [Pinctada imbricata]|uniref:Uncharacterized protein n=1 Tax=Pinctada imbricata TaxID=66713 RepID=A0AA89BR89_PINIB|nr:hypothetical protein FSP39_015495 [Pinctada imbricata]
MSSCPYYYRKNIDSNRVPRVITEAKCACQRCLKPCLISKDCRVRRSKCKETYIYIDVMRKHNLQGDYMTIVEPVAVGCSCIHRPPSRNARLCHHMPVNK